MIVSCLVIAVFYVYPGESCGDHDNRPVRDRMHPAISPRGEDPIRQGVARVYDNTGYHRPQTGVMFAAFIVSIVNQAFIVITLLGSYWWISGELSSGVYPTVSDRLVH